MRNHSTVQTSTRRATALALTLTLGVFAAACGDDNDDTAKSTAAPVSSTASTAAPTASSSPATESSTATSGSTTDSSTATSGSSNAGAAISLKDDCPANVVIQTDWWPEAEHGATYELIGEGYTIDADKKVVKGPLVAGGKDTGVTVEVRAGGSAISGSVSAEMVADPSIMFGYVNTEGAATNKDIRMLSVVAPLEKNPQMFMWDPATYPDVKEIKDLQNHDVPVLVFNKGIVAKWMVAQGVLKDSQIDTSYKGSPDQFVTADGKVAQQGFATAEPYKYEHDLPGWNKPVAFQTWYDAGFKSYSQTFAIIKDDKAKYSDCLKKLVPVIQQAQVDYITNPDRANAIILDAVKQYNNFWTQSPELMKFSVEQQLKLGIVGNGPDSTLGNMDEARIQTILDQLRSGGEAVPADLKVTDLFTNEFIDTSIGLKS